MTAHRLRRCGQTMWFNNKGLPAKPAIHALHRTQHGTKTRSSPWRSW